jgi:hypothetical protein
MMFLKQRIALLVLLFIVVICSCEKDDANTIEFSNETRLAIRDLNLLADAGIIFYDTLITSKIYLDEKITSGYNRIDEDGNVQILRPIFDKFTLVEGDVEIDYVISAGQDVLELKLNKSADSFDINLFFKWEVKKGELWELIEDLITGNQLYLYNYKDDVINSFIDEISIKNLDTVSVFSIPKVRFRYSMNKKIEFVEDGISLVPRLESFGIKKDDGTIIMINESWDIDNNLLVIKPKELLEKNTTYTLFIDNKFTLEYNNDSKSKSSSDIKMESSKYTEVVFRTENFSEQSIIDPDNIEYSYPIVNQFNFLPSEHSEGALKLNHSQADVTGNPNEQELTYKVRLINILSNDSLEYNVNFNYSDNLFTYEIEDVLQNESIYRLKLIKIFNTSENLMCDYYFRTSKYDTFDEKLDDMSITTGWRRSVATAVYEVGNSIFGDELFDEFEYSSLISFDLDLTNNQWYIENKFGDVYSDVEETTIRIDNRNTSKYGVPPVHAMFIRQLNVKIKLSSEDVQNQSASWSGYPTEGAFVSPLQSVILSDISNMFDQAYKLDRNSDLYTYLWSRSIPPYYGGTLNYSIKYTIPGGTVSSQHSLKVTW